MESTLQVILSIATAVATGFVGFIFHRFKKRDDLRVLEEKRRADSILARERATNDALRALCRDRILQGYRFYRQHGGVSTADLESMTKLYDAYHGLGGNGTISAVYDKIRALPIKEAD